MGKNIYLYLISNLFIMFTKIYYINLDRRNDRRKHIEEQIKSINWNGNAERLSAIDGNTLKYNDLTDIFTKESLDDAFGIKKSKVNTSKGALGCALSHRNIYQKVLTGNDDYVLILEDDIEFTPDFINKVNNLSVSNFDILWLGYHFAGVKENYPNYMIPKDYLYGLFGYVINKKAASALLNIFPTSMQLDSEIPKAFPQLKVFAVKSDNKLILSDRSEEAKTFGTDIQRIDIKYDNKYIKEGFCDKDNCNTIDNNNNDYHYINYVKALLIMLILFIFIIYNY